MRLLGAYDPLIRMSDQIDKNMHDFYELKKNDSYG